MIKLQLFQEDMYLEITCYLNSINFQRGTLFPCILFLVSLDMHWIRSRIIELWTKCCGNKTERCVWFQSIVNRHMQINVYLISLISVCAALCLFTQLCPTLCDPVDCSPPGSSVHGDSPGKNTGVGIACSKMHPSDGGDSIYW